MSGLHISEAPASSLTSRSGNQSAKARLDAGDSGQAELLLRDAVAMVKAATMPMG